MFDYITEKWDNYGWQAMFFFGVFVILLGWVMNIGKKGRMSKVFKSYFTETKNKRRQGVSSNTDYIPRENEKNDSKGEIECRRVMETTFKRPFNKIRPNFLRNVNGQNLELDIYNDELKIAVEYNGRQHYEYIPYFHRTRESFNNQKQRDFIKRLLCEKHGIFLIEVPYNVKINDIQPFILSALEKRVNKTDL